MSYPPISRFCNLLRRKHRAHQLGIKFHRASDFNLPAALSLRSGEFQLKMPSDNGSKSAFIDIFLDDCYRLRTMPDDIVTVVDIGAHVGLFSIAARNRWPRAKIHAYEPNPEMKVYWTDHSKQADLRVFSEAVSSSSGTVSLVTDSESVQVRSEERETGEIPQVAFAKVLARLGGSVDLVKLDCEGAEWPILKDNHSWSNVRFLTMEFHLWAGYSLEELRQRITTLGFIIEHCEMAGADFGLLSAHK